MTTQIPTSDADAPFDLAELNRLAGAFFASLPGDTPAAAAQSAAALPQSAATPHYTPDTSAVTAASGPGVGNPVAAASPALPATPHAPQAPQVPQLSAALDRGAGAHERFYFSQGHGYPAQLQDFDIPREQRVQPQAFGLPGEADLRALLQDNPRQRSSAVPGAAHGNVPGPTSQSSLSQAAFYFAVPQTPPQGLAERGFEIAPLQAPPFDVHAVRRDFPILQERVNGRQLVWFDNAATTQKPQAVIDRLAYFYAYENSNIHRAAHELAARATDAYEGARDTVRDFLGARGSDEIVFVRGATEAVNLVANTWGEQNIGAGDEIIISHLEHHANIVPWQQLAQRKGALLRVIPVDEDGQVLLDAYRDLLSPRTRLVAVTQVSNALGTVVPVAEIVRLAQQAGAVTLIDGAQSVSHLRVNVQALGCDFFLFSGHKIFGPTGIGALYGRRELLARMPPWQGGGNMIADVTFERTQYQPAPARFEAGTGNIADAAGLAAALDYVQKLGLENIARYEHALLDYATARLAPIPGVRLVGTARDKASVLSFVLAGYSTGEVGQALNEEGIAVRTGHHCAQPILRRFGLESTVRPSLAFYNTCEEVDRMLAVIRRLAGQRR